MHKLLGCIFCLFCASASAGLSFSAQTALAGSVSPQQQDFTLQQYIALYLNYSPQLQTETNKLKIEHN